MLIGKRPFFTSILALTTLLLLAIACGGAATAVPPPTATFVPQPTATPGIEVIAQEDLVSQLQRNSCQVQLCHRQLRRQHHLRHHL